MIRRKRGNYDYGLGRLPAGRMNKTEARYAGHLQQLSLAGEVCYFKFESVKLRLADSTFYLPDFLVMKSDGVIEFHEVKGFMRDDAAVKIKVAADLFPFRFLLVKAGRKGSWDITTITREVE